MAGRLEIIAALFVCMGNYMFAQDIRMLYSLAETCDYSYGSVLSTIPHVRSLVACAGICLETRACKSAMYYRNSSACTLNSEKADMGTLPTDCGVEYLSLEGQRIVSSNYLGPCNVNTECSTNGTVCVNNTCVCETGLHFAPEVNLCTTTLSDCKSSDWCFHATPVSEPWTNDASHLRIEMKCFMPLPSDVIPTGKLRTAIITDEPTVIQSFDFINKTQISDREVIFINRWNATNPYVYGFHMVYYGHVSKWFGHTPTVDVKVPNAQCRLTFL